MDDLRAVLDSVDEERPVLVGSGEGGAICILFAATHPDRVHSLLLWATAARFTQELPDFPWGFTPEHVAAQLADIDNNWGPVHSPTCSMATPPNCRACENCSGNFNVR
jgi:pimeloyl-ACP methyl ester carboxylesterase